MIKSSVINPDIVKNRNVFLPLSLIHEISCSTQLCCNGITLIVFQNIHYDGMQWFTNIHFIQAVCRYGAT